jgi:hypothetical protein
MLLENVEKYYLYYDTIIHRWLQQIMIYWDEVFFVAVHLGI